MTKQEALNKAERVLAEVDSYHAGTAHAAVAIAHAYMALADRMPAKYLPQEFPGIEIQDS